MAIYLVEYRMVRPGGAIREGVEATSADDELQAQRNVEDYLRIVDRKADIHIGDAVAV